MDDPSQDQLAIAALVAALVEALDEKHDGFTRSFLRHLDEKRARLAEVGHSDRSSVIDPLVWTKTLLSEDLDRSEPASVVYAKIRTPEEDQLPSSDKVPQNTLDEAVQFWLRLPTYDRERATIETASGHRLDFAAISALARRQKP